MASGRLVRSRRLPWAGLVCVIVILLMAVSTADTVRRRARAVGVDVQEVEGHLEILEVMQNTPADDAGLQAGDLILAAAGREIRDLASYDEAAATFTTGVGVDFEIDRDGRLRVLHVVPGRDFPWLRTLIEWLACLTYLAVGTVALVQLPRDLRARLLMVFSFAVALELAMPVDVLDFPDFRNFVLPLLTLVIGFQIGTELHLASSIPDRERFGAARSWLVPLFYATGGALGLSMALSFVASAAGWTFVPWSVEFAETVFWDVAGAVWAIAIVALLGTAVRRAPDPLARQQTLLVLLAGLPWSIYTLASIATNRFGGAFPEWLMVIEPLVLLMYPVGVLTAIFRYQLFDLEVVVKRSLVYTCLTGTLILFFYGAIGTGGALLSRSMPGGQTSVVLVGVATLMMGLLFSPMRRATQGLIDRQFFPERTALREQLIRLASDLPARGSLPSMGAELVSQMSAMFGLESAVVMLGASSGILSPVASAGLGGRAEERLLISMSDPAVQTLQRTGRPLSVGYVSHKSPTLGARLEELQAAMLVPLMKQERLIGILVLGRKIGGRSFPAEEVELLNQLSHHIATSFEYSRLYESATRDSLTGLLRRGAVLDALNRELDRSRRFGRPLAVAMVDIDRFKDVNDRHGHLKGDLILKRVAGTIFEGLRVTDQVGRYGGEEFLVVLPETDLQGAHVVSEKLRRLVQDVQMEADNGEEIRVTISLGVAALDQFGTGARPEVNDLISEADAALYRAKTAGRNRVEARAATG